MRALIVCAAVGMDLEHRLELVVGTTTTTLSSRGRPLRTSPISVTLVIRAGSRHPRPVRAVGDEVGNDLSRCMAALGIPGRSTISLSIVLRQTRPRSLALVPVQDLDEPRHVRALEKLCGRNTYMLSRDRMLFGTGAVPCTLTGGGST